MAFSGIIKDEENRLFSRGSYPVRLVTFTLLATVLGWAFSTFIPQLTELALYLAAGFGVGLALVLITMHVSKDRGERMFAALFFGCGFIAGMWGLWVNSTFGVIPTVDQIRASTVGVTYDVTLLGVPTVIQNQIFELWIAVTMVMASIPLLTSLAKPAPAGTRHNPFHVHPDFAQPFGPRLIMLSVVSFGIAAAAVYVVPYLTAYELPLEIAVLPPLVACFFYAKLHMSFPKAMIVSIIGGIAGAVGFWVPWLYMTLGKDQTIAFFQGTPQDILARVQVQVADYSYTSEIAGTVTDYSPWTFEIWGGLTLAYLCLPALVILLRRVFYAIRPV